VRLKFATYNLMNGGIDDGDDSRLRRQLTALAGYEPAVVALQECKYWGETDYYRYLHRAEKYLGGMQGFAGRSAHHGCHLAVFIRPGCGLEVIEQRHESGHPYWHGFARVIVTADGFPQPVQLVSIHLAPSSAAIRLAEGEAFGLLAQDGNAVIAGGDWNALPATGPAPAAEAAGRKRRKLDRGAAQAIADAGFTDAGAHLADPTATVGHYGPGRLPYRCDRIVTTLPAATITGHQVITDLDDASDHLPVITEFDLSQERQ
jgi:endonuclease/exonuclease/phosphatase family metal-dependent hydrolase